MPSALTIKFDSTPVVNDYIKLNIAVGNELLETFKTTRTSAYQVTIVTANPVATMSSWINAFNADYNSTNLYTVTSSGDEATIEHPDSGFFIVGNVENGAPGKISVVGVVDTPDPIPINITDIAFSEATVPCTDVQVDVTTDVLAVIVRVNGIDEINPNVANPFDFEWVRGAFIQLQVESSTGELRTQNIQLPQALSVSSTVVDVLNSPTGATITINVSDSDGLTLEYSLDDVSYQASNVFTGITAGNYIAYIEDDLGCHIEVPFLVPDFEEGGVGVSAPYSDLPSKSNSIRFARRVTWADCTNYKNDENTLSCELAHTQNPRHINQLFQDCDVITTQIRSNYENNVVTIIQEDGTEILVPVNQKSTNIGLKDKRDAIKYNVGGGQTGIYFTSGDTYDYDTDVVNGTYALNGGLPNWGFVGSYIVIASSWFQVQDIIFDESKNAEVLIIDSVYTGVETSIIVGSIYDLFPYEVYEFDIDMGVYPTQKIQVNITQTDSRTGFDEVVYLSEIIDIKTRHAKTIEIYYYNDVNTDILYSTGIRNLIRIPIEYIAGGISDETENEKTDINTYLVNAEVYELDEFHFDLLSKQLMRKVTQALSHKFVFMDEVQYVKESSPESTPLVGTNLYRMVQSMVKADAVYTTQDTGEGFSAGTIEVPALLEATSGGFIKIKE